MSSILDYSGYNGEDGIIFSIPARDEYLKDISKISMSMIERDDCSDFVFSTRRSDSGRDKEGIQLLNFRERLFFIPDTGIDIKSFENFICLFQKSGLRVLTKNGFTDISSLIYGNIDVLNKFESIILYDKHHLYYSPIWLIISVMRIWVANPKEVNKIFYNFNESHHYVKHQIFPMLGMVYRASFLQINNIPVKLFFDEDIFDVAQCVRDRYAFHEGNIFLSKSFVSSSSKDYVKFNKRLQKKNPAFKELLNCIASIQESHKEEYFQEKWNRHATGY